MYVCAANVFCAKLVLSWYLPGCLLRMRWLGAHMHAHTIFNSHFSRWTWVSQLPIGFHSPFIPRLSVLLGTGQNHGILCVFSKRTFLRLDALHDSSQQMSLTGPCSFFIHITTEMEQELLPVTSALIN